MGLPVAVRTGRSVRRLFAIYAAVSLVPVVALGVVLFVLLRNTGDARGLEDARDKAALIGRTVVAPLLAGADLRAGLGAADRAALDRSVHLALAEGDVARLRVRDLDGDIVYSDDGSGGEGADDEALDAAHGETVASLTHLNSDADDVGPAGPAVVEIYEPLVDPTSAQRVGVLELYVPYAPIARAVNSEQRTVTIALCAGLGLLWVCLLGVSLSVTGRLRRQAAANSFLATHDALTELPNRTSFDEAINHSARATTPGTHTAPGTKAAVAVIDLDRFKEINDVLGHGNGDALLTVLAARLRAALPAEDSLARLGGDEFGVLLTGVRDEADAVARLAQLRAALSEPAVIGDVPLVVEASIGVALAPADGGESEQLLARADLAMYVAKRQRLGIARYRPGFDYDASALALIAQLRTAINEDQLLLCYQPKGDLLSRSVTAVEALLRWQHPDRGLLYPDAFIPLAEQTELIDDLTRWVVRTAAQQVHSLDPTGQLNVAVNVSARSIANAGFADDLLEILAQERTDPRRVIVEITETALLVDPAAAAATLTRLSDAGVRVSIDDFGAGQTSLGYLATLPVSELKIDKTFVMPMLADERKAAIVRSVIQLGHSLGFTVTAEGVETPAILERLRVENCDTAQGYLLARPATQCDLAAAITRSTAALNASGVGELEPV